MAKKRVKLSTTSTRMKAPPKRPPPPPKIIGSSCTWRIAELQEFKVEYTEKEVDCKSLFDKPERWFNFDDLLYYKKGNIVPSVMHVSLIYVSEGAVALN